MKPNESPPEKPVNDAAEALALVEQLTKHLLTRRKEIIETIRAGRKDVVVIFIDMVGSSKLKIQNKDTPEKWIIITRKFYQLITDEVEELGGRVIKYIGDEVMAVFDGAKKLDDSANFVSRTSILEERLTQETEEEFQLKIAVDFGPVFLMNVPGQKESDVLGTPIDRCARIAKCVTPGVVLASFEYVRDCDSICKWSWVGEFDFKGVGKTKVFQLGERAIEIGEKSNNSVDSPKSQGQHKTRPVLLEINFLYGAISEWSKSNGLDSVDVDTAALVALVGDSTYDFPGSGPDTNLFRQVAAFVVFFACMRPIRSSLTDLPIQLSQLQSSSREYAVENAMFAFEMAVVYLHNATIIRSDKTIILSEKIQVSLHSYLDIIDALVEVSPVAHFKLVSVLFENLAYRWNPHASYPID